MIPSLDEVGSFASAEVRGTLKERYQAKEFSRELWRAMGEAGLFGISVGEEKGGRGGGAKDLALAVRRFAHDGCDMGLTLSWITHQALCVESIQRLGTAAQKSSYLWRLMSGDWVGAAAVSEQRTGAHPAGIQTTATPDGDGYILNGKKLYITDGTVADLLVVVAATGIQPDRTKELTAFLVESSAPGFRATPMELNFLSTSPHAEITFEGLRLDSAAVLGSPGEGHSQSSRSAFARERSLVLSAFVGLFSAAARACALGYARRKGRFDLEGNEAASWIHHMSALEAYAGLATDLVELAFDDPARWRGSMDILIYLGISYAKWATWIGDFVVRHKVEPAFPLDLMLNDMKLVLVGEGIIYKEGRRRYIDPYDSGPER